MEQEKKVTIELTTDQQKKIKQETGAEVNSLTYDALEDRFAPTVARGGRMMRIIED